MVEPGVVLLKVAVFGARRQDSRDGASVQPSHPVQLVWPWDSQRPSKVVGVWAVVSHPVLEVGPECIVLPASRRRQRHRPLGNQQIRTLASRFGQLVHCFVPWDFAVPRDPVYPADRLVQREALRSAFPLCKDAPDLVDLELGSAWLPHSLADALRYSQVAHAQIQTLCLWWGNFCCDPGCSEGCDRFRVRHFPVFPACPGALRQGLLGIG
ncbi:putative double-stranded RNA/RNA-DNA hybrid binding protein [Ceratocystis lukuohia]|uniref:Double-stranded RNA/RNA-DNA hybrid binding protein n=1 Tax=Ceratocystis lukuohia TaxID=2019550 RepID=A0ABR4MCJ3_9PEZI